MKRQKYLTLKDDLPRLVGAQYAAGEEWRNNSRKNKETEPKWKQHPVQDVTGDGSKVWCCKEQYCIGTWNVRSMIKVSWKLKQEMARVNINILGISELKWIGMGKFNSDDHYIYSYGQESLRRNGVAFIVNKRIQSAVLGCYLTVNDTYLDYLIYQQTLARWLLPSPWNISFYWHVFDLYYCISFR